MNEHNDLIYNKIKSLYNQKSHINYILKHVEGIEEEFDKVFKGTELDIPTTSKTGPEKVYAYLFGIHYCPDCGKKTSYRNRTIGYLERCCTCGKKYAGEKRKIELQENAKWYTKTFICKECGNEFKHIIKPNDKKNQNYMFCSSSCRCSYMHKTISQERKKEIAEKRKNTCIEKYGTDYVINSEYTRNKTKEKLGVEYPQYLPNYGEICKESYKKNHNGKEFHHTDETKKQILKTKLEKYGPLLSTIKNKTYIFPSGKEVYIQGYENFAIDILLKEYNEDDIIVERKDIKNCIGKNITYNYNNSEHVYFPDIYIKSKNLIIEVKSKYTYSVHQDINNLKRDAVLANGIDFKFMIIETFHKNIKSYKFI